MLKQLKSVIRKRTVKLVICGWITLVCVIYLYRYQVTEKAIDSNKVSDEVDHSKHWSPIATTNNLTEEDPRGVTFNRILINSYKRSGSTFLGRAVGWYADSFYWYEPLLSAHVDGYFSVDGTYCNYYKKQCQNYTEATMDAIFQYLVDIYNCDFSRHYQWIYNRRWDAVGLRLQESGPSWDSFRQCQDQNISRSICLHKLVQVCKSAKHRVVKLLRLDLTLASRLWGNFSDLKIVQLFRDPRGLLNSHIITKWFNVGEHDMRTQEEDVIVSCGRQRRDIQTSKMLLEKFPDRFKIVQYEDFDTYDKMKHLYDFLGMNYSGKAVQLLNQLYGGNTSAAFHPYLYRDKLRWKSVEITNKYCADIYRELGFVYFHTETDLRNVSMSPLLKELPYTLL